MTVRVAIAYNFHDHDWHGGKNYFASLFHAVHAVGPEEIEFVLVTGHKTQTLLPAEFPWVKVVRTSLLDRMSPSWLVRQFTLRKLSSDPLLAAFLGRHQIDLLSHSGHLGREAPMKTLAWLYDFQFMHFPEYWQAKHVRWSEQRYRDACRYCDGVIVSSHDALNDLHAFEPSCRAAAHVLQFVSNPVRVNDLPSKQDVLAKYELPDLYFHLPNQFWTNKNHRLVIDALALLKGRNICVNVVCTGRPADGRRPDYFDELMEYCTKSGVQDSFRVLGIIPYRDTQALMRYAAAVVNPSRFEGWSTTVEEAKTLHKRLLLSNIKVHLEQAPARGRFFSPDSPSELAKELEECLHVSEAPVDQAIIDADYKKRLVNFGAAYVSMVRSTLSDTAGHHR